MPMTSHPANQRMTRTVLRLLLCAALGLPACSENVRDHKITAAALDTNDPAFRKKLEQGKLSDEEKRLLQGYLMRAALNRDPKFKKFAESRGESTMLGSPSLPITVGDAIEGQRTFLAKQLKERAVGRAKAAAARSAAKPRVLGTGAAGGTGPATPGGGAQ